MIATKAFGMGIDIDDIEVVMHFAPTGNVCDYIQEIGRVARRPDLKGVANYKYMSNDFKHINRLHGLSTIKQYQLIEVIKKIYYIYRDNIKKGDLITKKVNEMLVDAESFSHIFESPFFSEDDGINKVKTAMLLIQKDFERTLSYSPFYVRPIPLFQIGFFKVDKSIIREINSKYDNVVTVVNKSREIFNVNLKKIWEKKFNLKYSFPKFKFLLYTKNKSLEFEYLDYFDPALKVDIAFVKDHSLKFNDVTGALKIIVNNNVRRGSYVSFENLVEQLAKQANISIYKAKSIIEVTLAAMKLYSKEFSNLLHSIMYKTKILKSGSIKYNFNNSTTSYFKWIKKKLEFIVRSIDNGELYLTQKNNSKLFKEYIMILGILESYEILSFKALGGRNSQLYIRVNQSKTMKEIITNPQFYKNRLLELVSRRHELSVQMLTYLYEGNFTSSEIWDVIENYFIGCIPNKVKASFDVKTGIKL